MPSQQTLRAMVEAARAAAQALARAANPAAANRARRTAEALLLDQPELFPAEAVLGRSALPPRRFPPALPEPGAERSAGPVLRTPRPPRQLPLFVSARAPRTQIQKVTQEELRALLPEEQANLVERLIDQVIGQVQRRYSTSVGRSLRPSGSSVAPVERMVSPEDLRQEALRLVLSRSEQLPQGLGALESYLYPKLYKAASELARRLTRPVTIPSAEQEALRIENRLRELRASQGLSPDAPLPVLLQRLKSSPWLRYRTQVKGEGRYLLTPEGASALRAQGLPRAVPLSEALGGAGTQDVPGAAALRLPRRAPGPTAPPSPKTPLDELLEKAGEAAASGVSPETRLQLALRELTDRQREVVTRVLGLGEGASLGRPMGIRETARSLGISPSAVTRHYQLALPKLQKALSEIKAPERAAARADLPLPPPSAFEPRGTGAVVYREAGPVAYPPAVPRTGRGGAILPSSSEDLANYARRLLEVQGRLPQPARLRARWDPVRAEWIYEEYR